MAQYWTALQVLTQVAGELGLPRPVTVTGLSDVQSVQLLSLLNSAGNELQLYYPWEQFNKEFTFTTVVSQEAYALPADLSYFKDQTQWDRTNHWPLLGPKSPQEWAWLKGALVAALPRQRYRISGNELLLWPAPGATSNMAMEYVSKYWVQPAAETEPTTDLITLDSDILWYSPWMLVKFVKFKFCELKGLPVKGPTADFLRVFNSLTGKDTGGKILSLSPTVTSPYLGPWSVQDGSWNVGP